MKTGRRMADSLDITKVTVCPSRAAAKANSSVRSVGGTWFLECTVQGNWLSTGSQDNFGGTSVIRKLDTTDQPRNRRVFLEVELSSEWREQNQSVLEVKGQTL